MADQLERLRTALADRYTIEGELGAGGMATVYLAEDLKHRRKVALKVLRPELAAALGPDRFLREIEIAAQLQHPHILMLIDSGEADGFLYYVMPYVEGQSLRAKLAAEGELPIADAVRILRDVVDALSHAHERGVVHRDIKPDNVMLSGRHALVTDFGVAKAVSEATGRQELTTAGVALGTPAYMAPEQAVAAPHIDHRADIYAVGAMAYELLTGRPPLTGTTPQAVLAAQVADTPDPVTKYRDAVPPGLAQLVMRCLEKKAADRWQSAEELLPQLEVLSTPSGGMTPAETRPVAAVPRRVRYLWGSAAAMLAVVIGLFCMQMLRSGPLTITVSNIRPISTDAGLEFQPALSPDGREVAYVEGPIDRPRIVVKSTIDVGGDGVRLAADLGGRHWFPAWSADGATVRFVTGNAQSPEDWREVGKLGGAPRPIVFPAAGNPDRPLAHWTPVGDEAFVGVQADSIFLGDDIDSVPSLLAGTGLQMPSPHWLHSFARSPDGRWVAFVLGSAAWRTSGNVASSSIWVIRTDGGAPVRITDEPAAMNESPQWLPDSRHLVYVSNRDGPRGVYVVEVGIGGPKGEPRAILGSSDPHSVSVSADGRTLAYAKFTFRQNIWTVPIPDEGVTSITTAVPTTQGNQVIESHDLSPGGDSIVFDGGLRGRFALYRQAVDGGAPTLVADVPGLAFHPRWSPDGSEIVFYELAPGEPSRIALVPAAGGLVRRLTNEPVAEAMPGWAPDGRSIIFSSAGPGSSTGDWFKLWSIPRDGVGSAWHQPVPLTDFRCWGSDRHPDGSSVACESVDELGEAEFVLVAPEGQAIARLPTGMRLEDTGVPRFSPDGSRLYFVGTASDGTRGVWWLPTSGGAPQLIITFDDPLLTPRQDLSVGEHHLYLTISEYDSDIYVADLQY